jgi:signal peptidase I
MGLPAASPRDLVGLLLGRRQRFRVAGPSMAPAIPDGTTVLVRSQRAQAGDIVLVNRLEADVLIVKRVDHITADGRVFLRGDGTVSTDSRDFGALPPESVLGVVVCTFP